MEKEEHVLSRYVVPIIRFGDNLVKVLLLLAGLFMAIVADVIMGYLGGQMILRASPETPANIVNAVSAAISVFASAIQILMWIIIKARGYSLAGIFSNPQVPVTVKVAVVFTFLVWLMDDFLDMIPAIALTIGAFNSDNLMLKIGAVIADIMVFFMVALSELIVDNLKEIVDVIEGGSNRSNYTPPQHQPIRPIVSSNPMPMRPIQSTFSQKPLHPTAPRETFRPAPHKIDDLNDETDLRH